MYLQVAIKFRIASTLANPPIFRKISTGSIDEVKVPLGSEASIKGVNNNCIFSGEEDLGTNDICFGEEDSDTNDICFGEEEVDWPWVLLWHSAHEQWNGSAFVPSQ